MKGNILFIPIPFGCFFKVFIIKIFKITLCLFFVAFKHEVSLVFLINKSKACSIKKNNLVCLLSKDKLYLSSGVYLFKLTYIYADRTFSTSW